MADSSDIDAALVTKLASDATLASYLQAAPNVFMDEAKPNSTKFVIVSLVNEVDRHSFGARAFEDAVYLVEARMLATPSTPVGNIKAAAARIDALLDGGTLTVAGYSVMVIQREERFRTLERDDADESITWHRRGGHYRIAMSL
jgi:hypothetical protein